MVYTRAGGSYVVARENFGPKVAQIASVALLIDYIVTVAVQAAAGTAAISSMRCRRCGIRVRCATCITVGVVLILAYGNLRGIREAGKAFAFPTYFFVAMGGLGRRPSASCARPCSAICRKLQRLNVHELAHNPS